jgi:choline-glycine betaine transporter
METVMTTWLSAGIIFTFAAIVFVLYRWGNIRCVGVTPVKTFTFIAILFTSGLDVGLIMFPLTEFASYADVATSPEYDFTNPLAIEFGFWAFLIWSFYFLTCFYFCVIEPRVRFFDLALIKLINNIVIIGTCAFTAYLLLINLPWYVPELGDGESVISSFYLIVFLVIAAAVYSSTNIRYVRMLSLASTWLFVGLIALMWSGAFLSENSGIGEFANTVALLGGYFSNIHEFVLPLNDYHEFYLYWWFAWSIMIGQFTSRFVGGLRTYQVLAAMVIFPSIPIAIWFTVLYYYSANGLEVTGFYNIAMAIVGITFVINSLDSLIRLYTDNLNLGAARLGRVKYFLGNVIALSLLTLLFKLDFLQIQWVGSVVIGLFFACFAYILLTKYKTVSEIKCSPKENQIDFNKIELIN